MQKETNGKQQERSGNEEKTIAKKCVVLAVKNLSYPSQEL